MIIDVYICRLEYIVRHMVCVCFLLGVMYVYIILWVAFYLLSAPRPRLGCVVNCCAVVAYGVHGMPS